ncbi:MAG TPA: response regulator [Bacteroidetes bacterium]|nr:response regulator [Bacteroidota bacterium]
MEGEGTGTHATVLVVDDEPLTRELITRFLRREGIAADVAISGREALYLLQQHGYDVVLADVQMPDISGIELYRRAKAFSQDTAFIMITGFSDTDTAIQALKLGAFDYLLKPLNLDELGLSVRKALEKRRMERELRLYREALENKVVRRTEELIDRSRQLRRLLLSTIQTLIFTLEAKDKYTEGHSRRVAQISAFLAEKLGLSSPEVRRIELAGLLHDIGKVGVHEQLLLLPRPLTEEEFAQIRIHPELGAKIVRPLDELSDLVPAILGHHERLDGSGYPQGLTEDEISLEARIVAVADAYEAMTCIRPYRKPLTSEMAVERLRSAAGEKFDKRIVDLLDRWREQVDSIIHTSTQIETVR